MLTTLSRISDPRATAGNCDYGTIQKFVSSAGNQWWNQPLPAYTKANDIVNRYQLKGWHFLWISWAYMSIQYYTNKRTQGV